MKQKLVKTLYGYKKFLGIRRLKRKQDIFKVTLKSGKELYCNFRHTFVINKEEVPLHKLTPGISELDTIDGKDLILDIKPTNKKDWVYDFVDVDNDDCSYLTNDINSHNCQFMGSTVTLIDADYIVKKLKKVDPLFTPDDNTSIWEKCKDGHKYLISIDTAAGVGSDYSVMNVFDITNYPNEPATQVAMWKSNMKTPPAFADLVYDSCLYWNNAYVIGEVNGLSNEILNRLIVDKEYENVYYDYENDSYGVYSHRTSKKTACVIFKEELESDRIKILDDTTITELSYFEEVSPGIFKAKTGRNFHDDCVVTCIWAAWFLKSRFFEDERDTWYLPKQDFNTEKEYPTADNGDYSDALEGFLEADKERHDGWLEKDEDIW
jgi:hypothetical protein